MKFSTLVLVGLFAPSLAAPAFAHIRLTTPKPRVDSDSVKFAPCGEADRNSARVTTYKSGQTIKVNWTETVAHAGYFRLILGEGGDNDLTRPTMESYTMHSQIYKQTPVDKTKLPPPVIGPIQQYQNGKKTWMLLDYYQEHTQSEGGGSRTADVKLPDIACDNCTLQLVQGMFDGQGYSGAYYYGCADLIIKADSTSGMDAGTQPSGDAGVSPQGGSGGPSQSGGKGGSGGNGGGSSGGEGGDGEGGEQGGSDEDEDKGSSGGCSFAAGTTPASAALLLLPLAVLFVRKRRRS